MIELKDVKRIYETQDGEVVALDVPFLRFEDKGLVLIEGGNGSGKSTMLNMIGKIDAPTEGEVYVNGKKLSGFKGKETERYFAETVSYIFQSGNLAESMTVGENLQLVEGASKEKIAEALRSVGLENCEKRLPSQLSLGQQQRAAIARARLKDASIILADEPTASLDAKMSADVARLLEELSREKLVLVVTHEPYDLRETCTRRLELAAGKIIFDSAPQEIPKINGPVSEVGAPRKRKVNVKLGVVWARRGIGKHPVSAFFQLLLMIIMFGALSIVASYPLQSENHVLARAYADKGYEYMYYSGISVPKEESFPVREVFLKLFPDKLLSGESVKSADVYHGVLALTTLDRSLVEINMTSQKIIADAELAAGRFAESVTEVVVTDYLADVLLHWGILGPNIKTYDDIVASGKLTDGGGAEYSVSGVVTTDKARFAGLADVELGTSINYSTVGGIIMDKGDSDAENALIHFLCNIAQRLGFVYTIDDTVSVLAAQSRSVKVDAEIADDTIAGVVYSVSDGVAEAAYYSGDEADGAIISVSALLPRDIYDYMCKNQGGADTVMRAYAAEHADNAVTLWYSPDESMTLAVVGYYDDYVGANEESRKVYVPQETVTSFAAKAYADCEAYLVAAHGEEEALALIEKYPTEASFGAFAGVTYPEYYLVQSGYRAEKTVAGMSVVVAVVILILSLIYVFNETSHDFRDNRRSYAVMKSLGASDGEVAFFCAVEKSAVACRRIRAVVLRKCAVDVVFQQIFRGRRGGCQRHILFAAFDTGMFDFGRDSRGFEYLVRA